MLFDENIYRFMFAALQEAEKAFEQNEVPIGAVVVSENRIIGRGFNMTECLNDPTAHAEMIATTAAANKLKTKILDNCNIFVTVEPCLMCTGAILLSRFKNLYFGAFEPKFGACGSVYNVIENQKGSGKINVFNGIYENESKLLLEEFFKRQRGKNKFNNDTILN